MGNNYGTCIEKNKIMIINMSETLICINCSPQLQVFRAELDSILDVLRTLQRQGIKLPIGNIGWDARNYTENTNIYSWDSDTRYQDTRNWLCKTLCVIWIWNKPGRWNRQSWHSGNLSRQKILRGTIVIWDELWLLWKRS